MLHIICSGLLGYFIFILYSKYIQNEQYIILKVITMHNQNPSMEGLWSIVEFEDGLEMIPSSWLSDNKSTACWPQFTSQQRFKKAVQNCFSPEDDWALCKVIRILGTASKYITQNKYL